MISEKEKERYLRQINVRELGPEGQGKLKNTTFLVVGAGGLGSPAVISLAASGAGKIILADNDTVETSNLSRQFLHTDARVGMKKAESGKIALAAVNPFTEVEPFTGLVTDESLPALLEDVDVVLDVCDNSKTRHAVNRVCRRLKKPVVDAAAIRANGQITVYDYRDPDSPCYDCSFPEDTEQDLKASSLGVLTILTAVVGTLAAAEAVKVATGMGEPLKSRVLLIDLLHNDWRIFKLKRDPKCPVCGKQD